MVLMNSMFSAFDDAVFGQTYRQKVVATGPLAYWPLTESSGTLTDVAGGIGNGTNSGATLASVTGAGATMGSAPSFNGTSSRITLPTTWTLPTTGAAMYWYKIVDSAVWTDGTTRAALHFHDSGGDTNNFWFGKLSTSNKHHYRRIAASVSLDTASTQSYSDTNWRCVICLWDSAGTRVYVDGTKVHDVANPKTWGAGIAPISASIGNRLATAYWKGAIGHCAIWNSALSTAQITTLSTAS